MMSSSKTARVPHSPPPSSRPLGSTGRRVPFGQIVERLARPHSRPRESVITGAHRHHSSHIYAQCDRGVGRGLGLFWLGGPVMLQTPSLSINIDQSKAHADEGDSPRQTTCHFNDLLLSGPQGPTSFQDELNVLNAHHGGNQYLQFRFGCR